MLEVSADHVAWRVVPLGFSPSRWPKLRSDAETPVAAASTVASGAWGCWGGAGCVLVMSVQVPQVAGSPAWWPGALAVRCQGRTI